MTAETDRWLALCDEAEKSRKDLARFAGGDWMRGNGGIRHDTAVRFLDRYQAREPELVKAIRALVAEADVARQTAEYSCCLPSCSDYLVPYTVTAPVRCATCRSKSISVHCP